MGDGLFRDWQNLRDDEEGEAEEAAPAEASKATLLSPGDSKSNPLAEMQVDAATSTATQVAAALHANENTKEKQRPS